MVLIGIHKENLDLNKKAGNNNLPAIILFGTDGKIIDTVKSVEIMNDGNLVAKVSTDHRGVIDSEGGLRAWIEVLGENIICNY